MAFAAGCTGNAGTAVGPDEPTAPSASASPVESAADGGPATTTPITGAPSSFNGIPIVPTSSLQATVAYPFLIPNPLGSSDYFPTVFAHLIGQPITWTDISTDLACVTLTNPSDAWAQATISVELTGYSTAMQQLVTVPANHTTTTCVNPTPTLSALYALSSPIPGQVHATVTAQGSTTPIFDDVHPVTITTGQTVFNGEETGGSYHSLYQYQAVLSMPKDPWVQSLLAPAAMRSAWGTFGAGGYGMHLDENNNPIPRNRVTTTIPAGGQISETVYFAAGESITLNVDGIACAPCENSTVNFFATKQLTATMPSTWSLDSVPQTLVVSPGTTAGQQFTIKATSDGAYQLMFFNSSLFPMSLTYHRTGTQTDTVIDTLQAVYGELQTFNITYESIASSYFDPYAAQSVRWPSTIHTDMAANCIDGSLLFASILEALQLEPVVVFIPGHAFVGVRQSDGSDTLWPVETTMLGTSSFTGAMNEGLTEYNNKAVPPIALMDIKAARQAGLFPIPE